MSSETDYEHPAAPAADQPIPPTHNEHNESTAVDDATSTIPARPSTDEPESWSLPEEPPPEIAGFWRRVAADLLDLVIAFVALLAVGFLLRPIAFALGPWGRFFGLFVLVGYWGYFNSHARNGQTLGKMALNLATVDAHNQYLSLKQSLQRALLLWLPIGLPGLVALFSDGAILSMLAQAFMVAFALGLLYSYIFNRTTRQGPHDIPVGTYVVKKPVAAGAEMPALPRIHRIAAYGLLSLAVSYFVLMAAGTRGYFPAYFVPATNEPTLDGRLESRLASAGYPNIYEVSLTQVSYTQLNGGGSSETLRVNVWTRQSCTPTATTNPCVHIRKMVIGGIFDEFPQARLFDEIQVNIEHKFDFLIANGNVVQGVSVPRSEFHEYQ